MWSYIGYTYGIFLHKGPVNRSFGVFVVVRSLFSPSRLFNKGSFMVIWEAMTPMSLKVYHLWWFEMLWRPCHWNCIICGDLRCYDAEIVPSVAIWDAMTLKLYHLWWFEMLWRWNCIICGDLRCYEAEIVPSVVIWDAMTLKLYHLCWF